MVVFSKGFVGSKHTGDGMILFFWVVKERVVKMMMMMMMRVINIWGLR